jgi:hypothetical protein
MWTVNRWSSDRTTCVGAEEDNERRLDRRQRVFISPQ